MCLFVRCFVGMLILVNVTAAANTNVWPANFTSALDTLDKLGLTKPDKGEELTGRRWGARQSPPGSFSAIAELWLAGERDYVELTWWRQIDRPSRTFVVALFYAEYGHRMETGAAPQFQEYINRFADEGKQQRREELDYVIRNLPELRRRITRILGAARNAADLRREDTPQQAN